jgi:hypothetical protein
MGHRVVKGENRRTGHALCLQRRDGRMSSIMCLSATLLSRLARGVLKRGSSANSDMFIALTIWFH